jgi:hypothetical protein
MAEMTDRDAARTTIWQKQAAATAGGVTRARGGNDSGAGTARVARRRMTAGMKRSVMTTHGGRSG